MSVRSFLKAMAAAKVQTVKSRWQYLDFSSMNREIRVVPATRCHPTSNFRSLGVEQAEVVRTTGIGGQKVTCMHACRNDLQDGDFGQIECMTLMTLSLAEPLLYPDKNTRT